MMRVNASGSLGFLVFGGGLQFDFNSTVTINDGSWHHVAAVRDGVSGRLYVDGQPRGTATGGLVAPLNATIGVAAGAGASWPRPPALTML